MIKAIDTLNYYFAPEEKARFKETHDAEGIACKLTAVIGGVVPETTPEQMIAEMDALGVEKVFLGQLMMFSYLQKKPMLSCTLEQLVKVVKKYPDRFVGMTTYNPFNIIPSLRDLETAVKQHGFKAVYVHIFGFDIPLNDRKMYPLFAKCVELGVPVSMQTGYVLEGMPSEHGRPIYLDRIALDFPELVIIGTHTGYPWCEELIAMAYKFENVYFGVSAHFPKYMERNVVNYINTRGQNKVIFGTNLIPFKPMLSQIEELGLREEAKEKLLRKNAVRVYKL
ncbi:MAG: amidohydrolase [Chloroflexi bacterium]|nr:amidohydrolase [Chloroflexota bacterium]